MVATCAAGDVLSDLRRDIGYDQLAAWLGSATPTGVGVAVTQVEQRLDLPPVGGPNYFPNIAGADFTAKTITPMTPGAETSGHATNAAKLFYSNTMSLAPGISNVHVWHNLDWLGAGVLHNGTAQGPAASGNGSRVIAHDWVARERTRAMDVDALRRADWLTDTYDQMQVAGNSSASQLSNLMHSAFNVLNGVTIEPEHRIMSNDLGDAVYAADRVLPKVVVPMSTAASDATPVLASVAALMVEHSAANPGLSNGSYQTPNGATVRHGDTSESITAMLMAAANRYTVTRFDNGFTYGVNTPHGLDAQFGAGAVNVFNSIMMLSAGEHDSFEDTPQEGGGQTIGDEMIGPYGFDYDDTFGGANGSNTVGTYRFTTAPGRNWLAATLAWNLAVTGEVEGVFDGTAVLHDLDLALIDVTDPMNPVTTAASVDTIHNTESIWQQLPNNRTYELHVTPKAGQDPFEWDYALAWRLVPDFGDFDGDGDVQADDIDFLAQELGGDDIRFDLTLDGNVDASDHQMMIQQALGTHYGDLNLDGRVTITDLSVLAINFNQEGGWSVGDLDGDGLVDISDLSILARNFGAGMSMSIGSGGMGGGAAASAVPEPGALTLLFLTATAGMRRGARQPAKRLR